jgi:hypothetical protein
METENSRIIVVDEPHTKFLEWISVSASKAKEKKDPEQESSPLSATPPKPSWNEPDGFQGLKFGQDLRKTVRACPQNWDGKSRCYFKLSKRAELPGDHYVLYNFGLIGGVWILTQAIQIQNKLVSISLYFQSHDFERLLAIFIARYRTPTHPDEKEVTNALGTRFRDRSA